MNRILPPGANLVPDNAKCVFSGVIFDVYQWPTRLYDGSSATFEMIKRPDTVYIIGIKSDKLVVVEDTQPHQKSIRTFPGGRVNKDDSSWLEAAQREMLEETGLSFKNWRLISVTQPVFKIEWFAVWYIAYDVDVEKPQNPDAGEIIKVHEFSLEECLTNFFDDSNPETQYLPSSVKNAKIISDLINIEEFDGNQRTNNG